MSAHEERIKELESVLRRALEYIGTQGVFDPPGSQSVTLCNAIEEVLSKGTNSFTGSVSFGPGSLWDSPKCKSLDCPLCHGTPPNAGPR
jgi:hypothetical protein